MSEEPIAIPETIFRYYRRVFAEFLKAARWGRDNLVLPVIGITLVTWIVSAIFHVPLDKHTIFVTVCVYALPATVLLLLH